eukprot:12229655-Ditylum_brightwellii.AAC.1
MLGNYLINTFLSAPPANKLERSLQVKELLNKLHEQEEKVVIPTDKTNNYKLVSKDLYTSWVLEHLNNTAQPFQ